MNINIMTIQPSCIITYSDNEQNMHIFITILKMVALKKYKIKLYKNTILNIFNIIEFINNKYDPCGIKLDGWYEHMNIEINNYDDIFEELYTKYSNRNILIPPELKLFMIIIASCTAFHFTKLFLHKMPGLDTVIMTKLPIIMSQL